MIDQKTYAAKPNAHFFRQQTFEKKAIVLHFTAGFSARGCFTSFQTRKNGTAFIVDRNGVIYQYFDPAYWACHIFRHTDEEPKCFYEIEKHTIGIEVVNVGPLTLGKSEKTKTTLYTYTNKVFCDLAETEKYIQGDYRKKFYWQAFTEEQYKALEYLLESLSHQFHIPLTTYPLRKRLDLWMHDEQSNFDVEHYRGVTTHVNYRSDKYDIGPGFKWERLFGGTILQINPQQDL